MNIILNDKKYYLHSYIIVVNNYINNIKYDHFIYHKILYKNNKYDGIERFDTIKSKVLKKDDLNKISPSYIKDEILYNNNEDEEYLQDNLSNKIVFCYYRRIF